MYSYIVIDEMEGGATDWTALDADTLNTAASTTSFFGTNCLEFDASDGAANATEAGAYRSISPALDLMEQDVQPHDRLVWLCYVSSLTDVAYAFVRLGESASNYLEWRVLDTALQAGWNCCDVALGDAYLGGTGWDPSGIDYMAVGVSLDAQDNALADIKVDRVAIHPASLTRA